GGRVAGEFALVAAGRQLGTVRAVEDGADRYVGAAGSLLRDLDGPAHPGVVPPRRTGGRRAHRCPRVTGGGRPGRCSAHSRSASISSAQPMVWPTSAVTSEGSRPSRAQRASSLAAGTPRSASSSGSPTGSASGGGAAASPASSSSTATGSSSSSRSTTGGAVSASSTAPRRDSSAKDASEPN